MLLSAILSGFGLAVVAPYIHRLVPRFSGWLLGILPLLLTAYFARLMYLTVPGEPVHIIQEWAPSLGVRLAFTLDGLSLLFALLISGIGTFIIIYAGGYMGNHPQVGRLYAFLLAFMGSMLGLVLSDNLIALFVFWELTSFTSYLLIGFNHREAKSRASALQALLVTGSGGLALLAGFVLLNIAGGSWEISSLISQAETIRAHPLYVACLILVLLGAFTKSAQFPFHFWLPGAMAAPSPVSAYLHSATMVKAGVYLIARFTPVLGETTIWQNTITTVGAITMLVGAWIAWAQVDLKRILAYSTVSSLGTLVMLLGIGTDVVVKAAIMFLVVHSLYKGALFLVAGAIDNSTGTRDIGQLGGLSRAMPLTAAAAMIAALSMAGIPPMPGFMGKELVYEAIYEAPLLLGAALAANILTVIVAGMVAIIPFWGKPAGPFPHKPHEANPAMLLGPILLGLLGIMVGLFSNTIGTAIIRPAAAAILGRPTEVSLSLLSKLSLYKETGLNIVLLLSGATLIAGTLLYLGRVKLWHYVRPLETLYRWGPTRWYELALAGLVGIASLQTRLLQNGYLRIYLFLVLLTTVLVAGIPLIGDLDFSFDPNLRGIAPQEWVILLLMITATVLAVRARSRITAVVALGVVGYGAAITFAVFGAPDLAITQFSIETLSVILLLLVLSRLPRIFVHNTRGAHLIELGLCAVAGIMIAVMVILVTRTPATLRLTPYFMENSVPQAHGRNVVNVILVDFRAFDTMGEIVVLGIAALGVFTLLKLRMEKGDSK